VTLTEPQTAIESAPRVAVDCRSLVEPPTGIGVYTEALLLELAAQHGARLTALAHRPLVVEAELRSAGIAVEHEAAPLGVLWQQLRLPRRLGRGDFDLFWGPLITLPLRCPIPAVVTVHDLTTLLFPEMHRLKVRWSQLPFLRPSFESARRIVAISEATAADLRFHFPQCADRVRVIYPGVAPRYRPGTLDCIASTREEFGGSGGYLLFVGTLEPRKGVDVLLDAWEALRSDREDVPPLVLAGGYGWGGPALLQRIERLSGKGVHYLGRVSPDRLLTLLQAARLLVYPSFYEGFGLPVAEALACGIPAVVSDVSSLPEVVGKAGLKVPPGEAAALASAIERVLTEGELEAELRERAPVQAARFRWDAAARSMAEVFREALQ
jgi:glycosyltransferase involved in cell wall biosynthesis